MKGAKLYVAILTPLALGLGLVMAVFSWNESWSQNHFTEYDPYLYLTLLSIILTFWSGYYFHPDKERKIIKITQKFVFKLKNSMALTAILFSGVVAFGVNNHSVFTPLTWVGLIVTVSQLHLIFTGSAIASGYVMITTYPESKRGVLWAIGALIFGVGGFLLGYLLGLYSIAWGEVLASLPLVVFMMVTWILVGTKFLNWILRRLR